MRETCERCGADLWEHGCEESAELCWECWNHQQSEKDAMRADAVYDAWRDGEMMR